VPHGMFWVINPYQESDGVIAQLTGSKIKCPVELESVHPGVRRFYNILKPMDFSPLIDVVLIWFGTENQYSAIAVGPFGRVPNYMEEIMNFHEFIGCIPVPDAWLHLVAVNKLP